MSISPSPDSSDALQPSVEPDAPCAGIPSTTPPEVEARFLELAREWELHVAEAIVCSVPGALLRCDAFLHLVEMGPAIVPLVFSRYRRYAESQVPWDVLLTRLTGLDLEPPDEPREHDDLRSRWLAWAQARGIPGLGGMRGDAPFEGDDAGQS